MTNHYVVHLKLIMCANYAFRVKKKKKIPDSIIKSSSLGNVIINQIFGLRGSYQGVLGFILKPFLKNARH